MKVFVVTLNNETEMKFQAVSWNIVDGILYIMGHRPDKNSIYEIAAFKNWVSIMEEIG